MSRPLYCDEHGHVMTVKNVRATFETTILWFCPLCHRELSPRDALSEIERDGRPAPTFEEWKAA